MSFQEKRRAQHTQDALFVCRKTSTRTLARPHLLGAPVPNVAFVLAMLLDCLFGLALQHSQLARVFNLATRMIGIAHIYIHGNRHTDRRTKIIHEGCSNSL